MSIFETVFAAANRLPRLQLVYIGVLFAVVAVIGAYVSGKTTASAEPNSTTSSAREMKLKRLWHEEWARLEQIDPQKRPWLPQQMLHCDYTTLTCQRGWYDINDHLSLYMILAEDRKTEIAHLFCVDKNCMSFDTGEVQQYNLKFMIAADIPENCLPQDGAGTAEAIARFGQSIARTQGVTPPDPEPECTAWIAKNGPRPLIQFLALLNRLIAYPENP